MSSLFPSYLSVLGLTMLWEGFTYILLHHLPALFKLGYSFLVSVSLKQNKKKQFIERNG